MNQPIPKVTEIDVIRIVQRDFPAEQFEAVMSILNEYGTEDRQRGVNRVRLAVLKLAGVHADGSAIRRTCRGRKKQNYPGGLEAIPVLAEQGVDCLTQSSSLRFCGGIMPR